MNSTSPFDLKPGTVDRSLQTPVDRAIDELIDARHRSNDAIRFAQVALEDAAREIDKLRRQLIESDVRWYSETALAKRIGVSKKMVSDLRKARKIPFSKFGRLVKYSSLDELEIAKAVQVRPKLALVEAA
jgi:hypothetical protein